METATISPYRPLLFGDAPESSLHYTCVALLFVSCSYVVESVECHVCMEHCHNESEKGLRHIAKHTGDEIWSCVTVFLYPLTGTR